MVKFSENQELAINLNDNKIIVSASAGSGKTTVLVERILEKIKSNPNLTIDNFLVITFTRKAAESLRNKIFKKINEYSSDENISIFKENLYKVSNQNITTIDGFYLSIVKQFYYLLENVEITNSDIFNDIASNYELNKIKEEVFYDIATMDNCKKLLEQFTINDIKNTVFFMDNKLSESPDKDIELKKWKSQYDLKEKDINNIVTNLYDEFINEIKSEIIYILEKLHKETRELIYLMKTLQYEKKDTKKKHDQRIYSMNCQEESIDVFLEKLSTCSSLDFIYLLDSIDKELKTYLNGKNLQSYKKDFDIERYTESLSVVKEIFKKFIEEINIERIQNVFINKDYVLDLINLVESFSKKYQERKVYLGKLEYSDIARFATELLKNSFVNSYYRNKYKHIFIDEFQDTNDSQIEMINLISPENTFLVGDIKQSIYSFRNTTPEVMKKFLKDENYRKVFLNNNYRSSKQIIEFNNIFYEKLMNTFKKESFIDEEDYAHAGKDMGLENNDFITFLNIDKSDNSEEFSVSAAKIIAKKIKESVDENKEENGYSKFAVLVRTNEEVETVASEFNNYGIPQYAETKYSFYKNESVQTVINFLKIIANNKDNLAWTQVLNSQIFQFSFDEILHLKKLYQEHEGENLDFYNAIFNDKEYLKDNKIIKTVRNSLGSLFEHFIDLDSLKLNFYYMSKLPVPDLLNQIYKINNFYLNKTTQLDRSSLEMLYNISVEKKLDLLEFNDFLDSLEELEIEDGKFLGNEDNVVKILTYHKAKGLEFDTVFVCFDMKSINYGKSLIINHSKKFGIGLKSSLISNVDNTDLYYNINKLEYQLEKKEEFLRVMYVATTRAENKLYVVGKSSNKDESRKSMYLPYSFKMKFKNINIYEYLLYVLETVESTKNEKNSYNYIINYPGKQKQVNILLEHINVNDIVIESSTNDSIFNKYRELIIKNNKKLHFEYSSIGSLALVDNYSRGRLLHKCVEFYLIDKSYVREVLSNDEFSLIENLFINEYFKYYIGNYDFSFEFDINLSLEDNSKGIIDFIAFNDSEIVIIDFKSDRDTNEEKIKRDHSDQLEKYSKEMRIRYPDKKVSAKVYSFEINKMIDIS